ncbi:uncharacterized protein LOC112480016 isoform X3 [Pteropus alecto]|uniref:uncharacterized protein LOC112480016 isoform X3 n=1 Tax=Pteropus alecto TaxID=9402 RepID=UPI000D535025|nr:uncharacterized protein LOC112480016 isoform X3 [Pteropus alecto]
MVGQGSGPGRWRPLLQPLWGFSSSWGPRRAAIRAESVIPAPKTHGGRAGECHRLTPKASLALSSRGRRGRGRGQTGRAGRKSQTAPPGRPSRPARGQRLTVRDPAGANDQRCWKSPTWMKNGIFLNRSAPISRMCSAHWWCHWEVSHDRLIMRRVPSYVILGSLTEPKFAFSLGVTPVQLL